MHVMSQAESRLIQLMETGVIQEMACNLRALEGVEKVHLTEQGGNQAFQSLIRVTTDKGEVLRLAISYVEDEELEEMFDETVSGDLLVQALEEKGCSCRPLRERAKQLEAQFDAECRRLKRELVNTETFAELDHLRRRIT